jgi:hypothetical protein
VFDIGSERVVDFLPTGGPVGALAIDPGGKSLFLAMGERGLRRISIGEKGISAPLNEVGYASDVALDRSGRAYVAYQDSGPAGRRGHDSVEVFDTESGKSMGA